MAKLFASEAAHRAADKAMQILASHGYRRGSVVERLFRDVRADGDLPGHVGSAADGHRGAHPGDGVIGRDPGRDPGFAGIGSSCIADPRRSPDPDRDHPPQPEICLAIVCSCRFDVPS